MVSVTPNCSVPTAEAGQHFDQPSVGAYVNQAQTLFKAGGVTPCCRTEPPSVQGFFPSGGLLLRSQFGGGLQLHLLLATSHRAGWHS